MKQAHAISTLAQSERVLCASDWRINGSRIMVVMITREPSAKRIATRTNLLRLVRGSVERRMGMEGGLPVEIEARASKKGYWK